MTPRHLLAPARLAGSRLLATQSDERLVDLSRAGSEPAFEAIVSRYRGALLRYCAALLGRERAEDAVQQTFVNAYHGMHRDERPLLLKPWLYRIAHNTAHNALRDQALRHEQLDAEGATAERPELELERREQLRSVLASVQDLPSKQRDALVLRELEGRSYGEIAAALGVGDGAVRQLLNRARTTLRTAATAITPVGLLLRLPTAGSGAGESAAARMAELTGAAGAGAVASKVAATALVTGAVVGGVAMAPLGDSGGSTAGDAPAVKTPGERGGAAPPAPVTVAPAPLAPASGGVPGDPASRRADSSGPGPGDTRRGEDDSSGRGDSSGPGPGAGPGGSNPGPGSGFSGSSGSDPGSSGSGPGSGSSGPVSGSPGPGASASSGPGAGSSGSGSSGPSASGSGSSGSGSESSGSAPPGSGSAGSASSGSGSSGSVSSGPALATSTSGSGSSGSG